MAEDDLSDVSMADLLRAAQGGNAPAPAEAPAAGADLSNVSMEDLLRAAQAPAAAAPQRSFFERLGNFAHNVYNNPPPSVATVRDIMKAAPAAAQELTYGTDPEAARQAAGTAFHAAFMFGPGTPGLRAGEGVLGAPLRQPVSPGAVTPGLVSADEAAAAAARRNITLPRFMAAETETLPQMAASLKNVPYAGQPIINAARGLSGQLEADKNAIAAGMGTGVPAIAGEEARQGIRGYIKSGSQAPVSEAYDNVATLVDPEFRMRPDYTAQALNDIVAKRANARIMGNSKAGDIVLPAVMDPTGMNYTGLKDLRSYIGQRTPQQLVAEGIDPAEAKLLYGALTKDLSVVVGEAGGEPAFNAWRDANALAATTKQQQRALTKIIGAKGETPPEQVINKLAGYAGSKSTADIYRLQLAKDAMGPDAWNEVGATLVNRMGMAPEGAFSADRFVTAFGNMAPAAKQTMFNPEQLSALNDLFMVTRQVQDRITRFSNPSGTFRAGAGAAILGGLIHAPVHTIVSLVGMRMAAKALAQPAMVRAATQASAASLRGDRAGMQAALSLLRQLAVRYDLVDRARRLRQQAPNTRAYYSDNQLPPGLSQQDVNQALYGPGWENIPGSPEFNARQTFYPNNPVNPAGWDAFMAGGPLSANIEDRRAQGQ